MKIAYVITERNGKSYWTKIGVAFENKDGSINVKLEAFPVNGELQLREYVPFDSNNERRSRTEEPRAAAYEKSESGDVDDIPF